MARYAERYNPELPLVARRSFIYNRRSYKPGEELKGFDLRAAARLHRTGYASHSTTPHSMAVGAKAVVNRGVKISGKDYAPGDTFTQDGSLPDSNAVRMVNAGTLTLVAEDPPKPKPKPKKRRKKG